MLDHDKRVALVTGGNQGTGYAIGRSLAQRRITVILGVRDPDKGATACSRLQGEGLDVNFELLDVTDSSYLAKRYLANFSVAKPISMDIIKSEK